MWSMIWKKEERNKEKKDTKREEDNDVYFKGKNWNINENVKYNLKERRKEWRN